jgi:hypothetical protein
LKEAVMAWFKDLFRHFLDGLRRTKKSLRIIELRAEI